MHSPCAMRESAKAALTKFQNGNASFRTEHFPLLHGPCGDFGHRAARGGDARFRSIVSRSLQKRRKSLQLPQAALRNRTPIQKTLSTRLRRLMKRSHQHLRCQPQEPESAVVRAAENRVANRRPIPHQGARQLAVLLFSNRCGGSALPQCCTTSRRRHSGWRFQTHAPTQTPPWHPAFSRRAQIVVLRDLYRFERDECAR